MLWTIGVILLILWLVGNVMAYTAGGLIHALLVIALIIVVGVGFFGDALNTFFQGLGDTVAGWS